MCVPVGQGLAPAVKMLDKGRTINLCLCIEKAQTEPSPEGEGGPFAVDEVSTVKYSSTIFHSSFLHLIRQPLAATFSHWRRQEAIRCLAAARSHFGSNTHRVLFTTEMSLRYLAQGRLRPHCDSVTFRREQATRPTGTPKTRKLVSGNPYR